MQPEIKKPTDGLYIAGLVMLVISFIIFCVSLFSSVDAISFFFVEFSITAFYFLLLLGSGRLRRGREGLQPMFVFLLLFLVSAYGLNREMGIFMPAVDWFTALLFVSSANCLLFSVFHRLPSWARYTSSFIAGISVLLYAYLLVYLLPMYIISLIGFFLLGFSLHTFVPLLLFIYTLVFFKKLNAAPGRHIVFFRSGIVSAVTVIIAFVLVWSIKVNAINKALAMGNKNLPEWIGAAQKIKPGFFDNRICKAGLTYQVAGNMVSDALGGIPSRSFDEETKHDPLVMMASLIGGEINLSESDRINILKSTYDSRHFAEERLWSGEDLYTSAVKNNIEVWPQFRLAYSQMKIKVENQLNPRGWSNTQEAIYTFHMPEGSVVTSLSLWIDGVEEKGILTTRSKADSAYKTIVGRERRDPSVVHWQEGNRVTVRVFPVESGKNREFKIGITSPLLLSGTRLIYQPVYFDGPLATSAKEETEIRFFKKPVDLTMSAAFDETGEYTYTRKGRYKTDWNMAFDREPVLPGAFAFNGKQYTLFSTEPESTSLDIKDVYLDVNASWSADECDKVYNLVKQKNVFVANSNGSLLRLTQHNADEVFNDLRNNYFTLFPFSNITHPVASLVITKSGNTSPILDDIKQTDFASSIKNYIAQKKRVHVFNIGTTLSPYLRTLKEVGSFNYVKGDVFLLQELLNGQRYPMANEKENEVTLDTAGITLRQSEESTTQSSAPDHVMRLFAYNHILKNQGAAILSGGIVEQAAITEAEEAYVVSPVSSLVVLESQRDYDRFDIKASKDSLKNASLSAKGAVPEPHEWAMIITALLLLLYVRRRSFDPSMDEQ